MAEALWSALDEYLVNLLDTQLGMTSNYSDLRVQTVTANVINDWQDWQDAPLPLVLVIGRDVSRKQGPHGDGVRHFEKTYPYVLLGIVAGDRNSAWQRAKVLEKRIESALRLIMPGQTQIVDDTGETLGRNHVLRGYISIARNTTSAGEEWLGFCAVEIEFFSTV